MMKKVRVLSFVFVFILCLSVFTGCNKKNEDFVKEFNEKVAAAKGLPALPEEMNVENDGKKKKVETATLSDGVEIRVETIKKTGFAEKIEIITNSEDNDWENYAHAIFEMYNTTGKSDSLLEIDGSTGDDKYKTYVKIDDNTGASVSYENGVRTITISRTK